MAVVCVCSFACMHRIVSLSKHARVHSGEIDFNEFCTIMAKKMQATDPEEDYRWVMAAYYFAFSSFRCFVYLSLLFSAIVRVAAHRFVSLQAFNMFDTGRNEYITAEELVDTFMAELGESLAIEEVSLPVSAMCSVVVVVFHWGRVVLILHAITLFRLEKCWRRQTLMKMGRLPLRIS